MHALLAAHRNDATLEGERTSELQLVGDHACNLFLVLVVNGRRPCVREQGHDASLRLLLGTLRRHRSDLLSIHRLRSDQRHHVAGRVLVLDRDVDGVEARLQACRNVLRDISTHVAFFRLLDLKHLRSVRFEEQSPRPDLRATLAIHLAHAQKDALVVLSPRLQVREVQRKVDIRAHNDVAEQHTIGLCDSVERVHVPEAAQRAPEAIGVPGVVGVLQVVVVVAVRAPDELLCGATDASHLAGLRERPLPQLVPERDHSFVSDSRRKPDDVDLGRRRWHETLVPRAHLPSRRVNILPRPGAHLPHLDGAAGEDRHRCDGSPTDTHLPRLLVQHDKPWLLRRLRDARHLLRADARRPRDGGLGAPSAVDEERDGGLVLDALLEAGRDGLAGRLRDRRTAAEVPVLAPDASQLDGRGLGTFGK
mmetsp:Transcript_110773/g.320094  ORF Transcript_110773/g.320094 Transcript_110773/m.320094 type:complete len:421 (-) Transcript_110773:839-2101(-)